MPRRLLILGSTGSIGTQALDVVRAAPEGTFEIVGLAAGRQWEPLLAQAREFGVDLVGLQDPEAAARAGEAFDGTVLQGPEGLVQLVLRSDADLVLNALVGAAGLGPTVATLGEGVDLALANKESLVVGGELVMQLAEATGAQVLPVDSEHSALWQLVTAESRNGESAHASIERLVLTASGGPFRGRTREELADVGVEQALKHPTWAMGGKITIDSATLMNKGLEVIEAHELFDTDYDDIDVVVHPQSIVHSMAEFTDGATIAQLSMPDMRLPIAYALAYPDRVDTPFGQMDWTRATTLEFEPPDRGTFRCLDLAYAAGRAGETAPAWLSAANEVAVDAFLDGRIGWAGIASLVDASLQRWDGTPATSLDAVLEADRLGRVAAHELLSGGAFDRRPSSNEGAPR